MQYEELVIKYGEDNAKYLWETLGNQTQHYDRLTYIHMGLECEEPFRERARCEAEGKGWTFDEVEGSMALLRKLIHGEWDEDFLLLEPGQTVQPTHDLCIVRGS
jgi:hypothetical protein